MHRFDELFTVHKYPAGEPHVQVTPGVGITEVKRILNSDVKDFNDLCIMVTANNILRYNGVKNVEWYVPYFPFGRHDRRNHQRDGVELYLALELVKKLNLTIIDPHSDVSGKLRHIPQSSFVAGCEREGLKLGEFVVCIPDAGASKKAYTWLNNEYGSKVAGVVEGYKHRDPLTGKLSGFGVHDPAEKVRGNHVLIVDDICDGGGTFIGLGAELERLGARSLTLAVTHGLFTKGLDELNNWFYEIWTLDTTSVVGGSVRRVPTQDVIYYGSRV